ncbi:membrane lipoprotein lipid attachment site-containing protein [Alkaliphilus sp. B6464]|uniref:membrane lipoprotein lipid attachment site-containing protein n=1 Tax=Alkaliphilus sp. B6464 TaxID=2731219 RepID=UPI001BA7F720|nr:membrane lipoprotein lipid attachment site-containing protein [Alkaliphilus sp. B6464]QUH21955.1 membrane lipoprotein lipid attachment site-containing protein [Alkaliphilus sp. B6464]
MKKIIILLTFVLFAAGLLTGCNFKKDKIIKDVSPYIIMQSNDRSVYYDKKAEFKVYLRGKASTSTLKTYGKEIIANNKNNYDAILILFYDIQEEALVNYSTPLGVVTWGPKGKFNESIKVGESNKNDNIIVVQNNTENHKVTAEEKDFYNQYLKYVREHKEATTEDLTKRFNKTAEELENQIIKVKTRFNEDIKLP